MDFQKLFDFLGISALDEKYKRRAREIVVELSLDHVNGYMPFVEGTRLTELVNLVSGTDQGTNDLGQTRVISVLSEADQEVLKTQIKNAIQIVGKKYKQFGPDLKRADLVVKDKVANKKMNESSGTGGSTECWNNWWGVNTKYVILDKGFKVVSSHSPMAEIGATLTEVQVGDLKKQGFQIHISRDTWR